jgi:hypothetical protein
MANHTKESLENLAIILSLSVFFAQRKDFANRDSLKGLLEAELEKTKRYFYSGADLWESTERREAIARMLWAYAVRDEGTFYVKQLY